MRGERAYRVNELPEVGQTCCITVRENAPAPNRLRSRPSPPHTYSCAAREERCAPDSSRSLERNGASGERGHPCEKATARVIVTRLEMSTRCMPTSSWSSPVGSCTTSGVPLEMCGLAAMPGEVMTRFFGWFESSVSSASGLFLDSIIAQDKNNAATTNELCLALSNSDCYASLLAIRQHLSLEPLRSPPCPRCQSAFRRRKSPLASRE